MQSLGRFIALGVVAAFATPVVAQQAIQNAEFAEPTGRYDHGILGDQIEYGALVVEFLSCQNCADPKWGKARITLPEHRVFEDLAPRVVDLDGDGLNEVVVIETDLNLGAQLAVYDMSGKVDATPFIGLTHRWLAPIGAADLDGDGFVELSYILKPHLTRELLVWRWQNKKLTQVARIGGLTNHQIGQDFISGGIRDCGQGPEMITADSRWSRVMATTFDGKKLMSRALGPFQGKASFKTALACK